MLSRCGKNHTDLFMHLQVQNILPHCHPCGCHADMQVLSGVFLPRVQLGLTGANLTLA